MFTRRMLPVSILLTLVLTLMMTASVSAQEADLGGEAVLRDDNDASDSLVMAFTEVPPPPDGSAYEGWLLDAAGGKISLGILIRGGTAAIEQTYASPTGENLAASYSRFAISIEPVPDPDPETPGPIAYSDTIPAGAFTHLGHLIVSFGPNPDGKGIAVGLREQMAVALAHAQLAENSSTLAGQQTHSQHVINIIEGSDGPNFDADAANPGDGKGVLTYAADLVTHAQLAAAAAPEDDSVGDGAADAVAAAESALSRAERAVVDALRVVNTSSTTAPDDDILLIRLGNVSNLTKLGLDDAKDAYTASQDMGLFEGLAGGAPPDVGDPLVPAAAMAALLVGLLLTGAGGLLVFRRRQTA